MSEPGEDVVGHHHPEFLCTILQRIRLHIKEEWKELDGPLLRAGAPGGESYVSTQHRKPSTGFGSGLKP